MEQFKAKVLGQVFEITDNILSHLFPSEASFLPVRDVVVDIGPTKQHLFRVFEEQFPCVRASTTRAITILA